MPRKRDIRAGVAAHNRTAPARQELPPEATRLLAVMFAQGDVCQRSVGSLLAEGFGRAAVIRLLRGLTATGFVSKDPGQKGLTSTFRLHLPPRRQP